MKTIRDVEIAGKRVLTRVDFNVPLNAQGDVADDARIRGVLPTLTHILEKGARLIIASHLGRPKGKPVPEFSLAPAAKRLKTLLGRPVAMAEDCVGPSVQRTVADMKDGDVLMLENLRFHAEEQADDDAFGRALAGLCDVYVNDAFAVCHRVNASVSAVVKHAPVAVAGFLLEKEMTYFQKAMSDPARPLVAIVGGAKVSSKLTAIRNMLEKVDKLIIGGAMANTFLKQRGVDVGKSKVEDDLLAAAEGVMKRAQERGIALYLPKDAVVADEMKPDAATRIVSVDQIPANAMVLDIGPDTLRLYGDALADAGTAVWNGPMGVFEMDAFSNGTVGLAEQVANLKALTIVGGGDTDSAIHKAGVAERIGYISTGGGAFLTLLEGKSLPAVAALEAAERR